MKFKVGDKARVIANRYDHNFNIGEIITIIIVDLDDSDMPYKCLNNNGTWWLSEEELEPFESTIVIKENTGIKEFAIQVVKYLEDHYGDHNYKAFLEVVNDKLK